MDSTDSLWQLLVWVKHRYIKSFSISPEKVINSVNPCLYWIVIEMYAWTYLRVYFIYKLDIGSFICIFNLLYLLAFFL